MAAAPICRICYDFSETTGLGRLIRPCNCRGSLALVHSGCLNQWMIYNEYKNHCDICHARYEIVPSGFKPLLQMTWLRPVSDHPADRFDFGMCIFAWLPHTVYYTMWMIFDGRKFLCVLSSLPRWQLCIGVFSFFINFYMYVPILKRICRKWYRENRIYAIQDKNSPSERKQLEELIAQADEMSQ